MFRGFISERCKLIKIADHSTAATDTVTSIAVDTAGYDGALFFTSFGTAATGNTIKLQSSSDDGGSDAYADLTGTSVSSGSSDEDVYQDIQKPRERYLKCVGTRGTSSTLESMWVLLYNARTIPITNSVSGTIIGETSLSPAEGTA